MKIFHTRYLKAMSWRQPLSCNIQCLLQFFGIAVHNPFRDECCIGFECCSPREDSTCWLHIDVHDLPIKRLVWYEPTVPKGDPDRTFIKKSKWVIK
jgi:hypothetical protein